MENTTFVTVKDYADRLGLSVQAIYKQIKAGHLNVEKIGNFQLIKLSEMEKPTKEKYGWHNKESLEDVPSGWMFEGGEEAYEEALTKWNFMQDVTV